MGQENSLSFPVTGVEMAGDLVDVYADGPEFLAYTGNFFHGAIQGDIFVEEFDLLAGEDPADNFPDGVAVTFLPDAFQPPVLLPGHTNGDGSGEKFFCPFYFFPCHGLSEYSLKKTPSSEVPLSSAAFKERFAPFLFTKIHLAACTKQQAPAPVDRLIYP